MTGRINRMVVAALTVALVVLAASAKAHKASDSYLTLEVGDTAVTGRWDIALRDLEHVLGLDADADGAITWGELRRRHEDIAAYALSRLAIAAGDIPCALRAEDHLVDRHSDGAYAVIGLRADCPVAGAPLSLRYDFLFDVDPLHRGLVHVRRGGASRSAVLSPDSRAVTFELRGGSAWETFATYWHEGVRHIWMGYDHILFLVTLLLASVLCRQEHQWRQVPSFRPVFADAVAVVTAFTLAHSLTLAIAVLGWVVLPSRSVEAAIAATIVLAALNNLFPVVEGHRWVIAFVLGLVHGFGFAGVLTDLGLPDTSLAAALAGFNIGVETGQLAIVAALLPLAYTVRNTWFYRRAVFGLGSFAAAVIGGIWLLERGLDLKL